MKNIFNFVAILITITFLASCSSDLKASSKSKSLINWHNDYQNALQVAQTEDKPVMLDLYTDWCHWCTELDEKTFVHASVVDKANSFIAVKIDAETDMLGEELIEKYNVIGYPAVLFLDKEGNLLTKVNGFVEGEQFAAYMDEALLMPSIISEIKSGNNKNIETVDYYMNIGEIDNAYMVFNDMVTRGSINYIDGSSKDIASLEKDFVVSKYFDIGLKYMYELGEIENAQNLYEKIAKEYEDSEYIFSIDINILNLFMAENNEAAIVPYIENIAMKRNNLPSEYAEMYQSVLDELKGSSKN